MKEKKLRNVAWVIVLLTLVASIVYTIIRLCIGGEKPQSDYTLMLLQCCLGIVVLFLPNVVEHRWNWALPNYLVIFYYLFLYCAIYLGEVRSFYYVIPFWDSILHGFSAGMLGIFGLFLVNLLNRHDNVAVQLSPVFVALFSFCFALAVGAFWEIYEFTGDSLLGLNMQKFRLEDGTQLVGHEALKDTMKDIIIDALGAFTISFIWLLGKTGKSLKLKHAAKEEIHGGEKHD